MSGGTWDFQEHHLRWLAEALREGRGRGWQEGDPLLEMERPRLALACVLDTLVDLIRDLDHHFTGDSHIPSEQAWLLGAGARIRADADAYFGGQHE